MIIRFPQKTRETFFLHHAKGVLFLSVFTITMSYFFIDIPLANYFEHWPHTWKLPVLWLTDLIDPKENYLVWPILFFFLRFIMKQESWGNRSLLLAISIPMANLVTEFMKHIFGRARPELLFTQGIFGFTFFEWANSFLSFPSGHACTIGAICGAFAGFWPHRLLPLLFFSLLLAFTRVILTMHFLSDVIGGLTIGLLISQWVYLEMKRQNVQF